MQQVVMKISPQVLCTKIDSFVSLPCRPRRHIQAKGTAGNVTLHPWHQYTHTPAVSQPLLDRVMSIAMLDCLDVETCKDDNLLQRPSWLRLATLSTATYHPRQYF